MAIWVYGEGVAGTGERVELERERKVKWENWPRLEFHQGKETGNTEASGLWYEIWEDLLFVM